MEIQRRYLAWSPLRPRTGELALRYDLLGRLARAARRHRADVLAFGFDTGGVRVVIEGGRRDLERALRALEVGLGRTTPELGIEAQGVVTEAAAGDRLTSAVVWAHQAVLEAEPRLPSALASAWSSHRDVLGHRRASFVDGSAVGRRVDLARLTEACGGLGRARRHGTRPPPLLYLSRLAASVVGRVPADPRTFALFAQAARRAGWRARDVGDALLVGTRRVRQLCAEPLPELALVASALGHPDTLGRLPSASLHGARVDLDREGGVRRDVGCAA